MQLLDVIAPMLDVLPIGDERIHRPIIHRVIKQAKDTVVQHTDVLDTTKAQTDSLAVPQDTTDTVQSAQNLA